MRRLTIDDHHLGVNILIVIAAFRSYMLSLDLQPHHIGQTEEIEAFFDEKHGGADTFRDFSRIFCFLTRLGLPGRRGQPPGGPRKRPKASRGGPQRSQEAPDPPKRPQEAPPGGPRRPPEAPKWPQEVQTEPQKASGDQK